jgi:glycerophosphoryl diester phosphodiesterase
MKYLIYISVLFLAVFCNPDESVTIPKFNDDSFMEGTLALSEATKSRMEGVYKVATGTELLGNKVILKLSKKGISIFGEKESVYLIMESGSKDSDIRFEGYWRYAVNSETGLIRLEIPSDSGGDELLSDTSSVTEIIVEGGYGFNNDSPNTSITLEFERPFSKYAKETEFFIVAHRGGGRTADRLPASENSLEILHYTELLGANAIEIDVRLSTDGVSFLYHDNTINLRLTQKGTVWGQIEDFSYPQLRTHLTLVNGEKIPTLSEVLEYTLNETEIEFVWLDMKAAKNDIDQVAAIQKEILDRAQMMGRKLEIAMGLPTEEKREQYLAYSDNENIPSLNESTPEDTRISNSVFWGPRWTLGLQNDEVEKMHSEGRRVITWTMDDPTFIQQYLSEGNFNGMVTNYPTLIAYYHYSR